MKVQVNQDKCIGCGSCPSICPTVFSMSDDSKAKASGDPAGHEDEVKMAKDACPTEAIELED